MILVFLCLAHRTQSDRLCVRHVAADATISLFLWLENVFIIPVTSEFPPRAGVPSSSCRHVQGGLAQSLMMTSRLLDDALVVAVSILSAAGLERVFHRHGSLTARAQNQLFPDPSLAAISAPRGLWLIRTTLLRASWRT